MNSLFDLLNTNSLKPHQIEALAWLQSRIDIQTWTTFQKLWKGEGYLKVFFPDSQE